MIFGVRARTGSQVNPDWIAAIEAEAALWPSDYRAQHRTETGYIANHERSAFPGAQATGFATRGDWIVTVDGRIDNLKELQGLLDLPTESEAQIVLSAYLRWGANAASKLIGDFAFVIANLRKGEIFLARDPMGVRPLFFAKTDDFFAFASSMAVLIKFPFVSLEPDRTWLGNYLENIKPNDMLTPYRGIRAMKPATWLAWNGNEETIRRYWTPPATVQQTAMSEAEAAEEWQRLFDQAVACRLPSSGNVACELSGGLDSTSIAVSAAPVLERRGQTFITLSHAVKEDADDRWKLHDERELIEHVRSVMPPSQHYWLTDSLCKQVTALEDAIGRHGGLLRRDFNSVQHGLPQILKEANCRVLLSGFGGDQLATSDGRGIRHSLALQKQWDAAAKQAFAGRSKIAWRTPLGRKLLKLNAELRKRHALRNASRLTRESFISQDELFKRRIANPLRPDWGSIGERERQVIVSSHIGQRGQDSAVGAGSMGFRYSYPMLDLRLIDFMLKLPDRFKRTQSGDRLLVRQAMVGRLPDIVRLRRDKSGAANPVVGLQFTRELHHFIDLFEKHRKNALVNEMVDLDWIRSTLTDYLEGKSPGPLLTVRNYHRVAALCLWAGAREAVD